MSPAALLARLGLADPAAEAVARRDELAHVRGLVGELLDDLLVPLLLHQLRLVPPRRRASRGKHAQPTLHARRGRCRLDLGRSAFLS